ncbi:MAG: hypothetical protein RL757_1491 [Bacteroidota bacterium]|jgi:hypothetical protein
MYLKKEILFSLCCILLILCLSTGCGEVGFMSEKNSWLPREIESLEDFFHIYLALQLSIFFISILLSFVLSKLGYFVSLIIHFIWIVSYRDYGFFSVLMLFSILSIILILIANFRKIKY